MSVRFEFYLGDEYMDRLFAAKEDSGRNELTANEYAKELLEAELLRLHPKSVKFDENGERIK